MVGISRPFYLLLSFVKVMGDSSFTFIENNCIIATFH